MSSPDQPEHDKDRRRDGRVEYDTVGVLTVPNVITVARMAASAGLVWIAHAGLAGWFVGVFVVLMVTDWVDGKIAVLLHQRTEFGSRLDSFADVVLYVCLLVGMALLKPDFVRAEAVLIGLMLGSYALSVIIALARFRRPPAYHTFLAKLSWWLAAIGAVTLLTGGLAWPARVAIIAVTLGNAEQIAISCVLPRWRADVRSILHAVRARRN